MTEVRELESEYMHGGDVAGKLTAYLMCYCESLITRWFILINMYKSCVHLSF